MSFIKDLPPEKRQELRKIYEELEKNETDYWNLPHYGLIADWFLRYWNLHNSVLEFMDQEPCEEPAFYYKEHKGL